METVNRVGIGADVGKLRDPSAVAVAERQDRDGESHYVVRHLERLPLGTPYPDVAARLHEIVRGVEAQSHAHSLMHGRRFRIELTIDATGIGLALADLLHERGLRPVACFFTGTDQRVERADGSIRVGKLWLVNRLQVLLQAKRLHLPTGPESQALAHELMNYEIRVNDKAHAQMGAFRDGTHDDLVTALMLAVGVEDKRSTAVDTSAFGPEQYSSEELFIRSHRSRNRRLR